MSLLEAKQLAQILGATHYRIYFVHVKASQYFGGSLSRTSQPQPFSHHFFDNNDEELAYYSVDMGPLVGLTELEKPRVWSNAFKLHPNYSEPIDFRSSCVYHKFTKEGIKRVCI